MTPEEKRIRDEIELHEANARASTDLEEVLYHTEKIAELQKELEELG